MVRAVKVGVTFPHLEIGSDPLVIRTFAQAVEMLGFSHITAFDHVLGAVHQGRDQRVAAWPQAAYGERDAFHEPLVLFGYLAGVTTTLGLATGVLILPQRQAIVVAKQAAEVDLLSGGRLRLGVGIGWNHLEYEALGQDWDDRGARMTEQIEVMRALWEAPVVEFAGKYHSVPRMGINPRPAASIPIWIGAGTPRGLRRAARYSDGVMSALPADHPETERWITDVRAALDDAGRDPAGFGIEGRVNLYGRQPDQIARDLERWRAFGATHVSLNTMVPPSLRDSPRPADQHISALREVVDLVGRPG
jgi:probable F420-dependent oxidoreductase